MDLIKKIILGIFLFCSSIQLYSQTVCNGALGDPVTYIDFGNGTNVFATPLQPGNTNYTYVADLPDEGFYTITNNTSGPKSIEKNWHQTLNHSDDGAGYMMIVNSTSTTNYFYQTVVNNLCPNTSYEFAVWVMNLNIISSNNPNLTFEIVDIQGNLISLPHSTGDIAETKSPTWKKYTLTFKTPQNASNITLKIKNNTNGGNGNDFVIDDLSFRPCGPSIITSINNTSILADLCEGYNFDYNLTATISSGLSEPAYQWQILKDDIWVDMPGENKISAVINFKDFEAGYYYFRLLVSEKSNSGISKCSIISPTITFNVESYLNAIITTSSPNNCSGTDIMLSVDKGNSFEWIGPNGFKSNLKNPIIKNADLSNEGLYTVKIFTKSLCSTNSSLMVKILPPVKGNINVTDTVICQNNSFQLIASGGITYSWTPTKGLSNANIPNPIASPEETTTYSVLISNGNCSTIKSVKINVLQNSSVNAGLDKQILAGQSVVLNGTAIGPNVSYEWTPKTYLDNPFILNPKATPQEDITYKLTVKSDCGISMDEVNIRVFSKLEIPSTFTPNNDGVNDTWNIPMISFFTHPKLKIFNRSGQLVFESDGRRPWDGTYNNLEQPIGVYYYTLFLTNELQTYSGWVMLTR